MIDTAEGAHDEVSNMLQRMRELAVQSGNDSNSDSDRAALQLEIDQLLTEMDRISARTIWGGKTLMGGEQLAPKTGPNRAYLPSWCNYLPLATKFQSTSTIHLQKLWGLAEEKRLSVVVEILGLPVFHMITQPRVLSIVGQPENGDNIIFDVNGLSVTARIRLFRSVS